MINDLKRIITHIVQFDIGLRIILSFGLSLLPDTDHLSVISNHELHRIGLYAL